MLRRFHLEEPESVKDASDLLARYGDSARAYAGGTELLLAMKEGLVHYEHLVNLKKIQGLDRIQHEDNLIRIGALATHRQVAESRLLQEHLPSFVRMEQNVANIRVREVGTIGGNLCFAEPHADPGTLLLVFGAKLVAAKGSSQREIPAQNFFVDAYETALEEDEVLTQIQIPLPAERSGVAYMKFGYLERPSVGVALLLALGEGGSIADIHVAVGCAGPAPKRVEEAEELLRGKSLEEGSLLLPKAGEVAGRAAQAISDLHGSQEYKEHIAQVLLKRTFEQARKQCLQEREG
ncbi:MAG: xanthine dehydrogenase family protein subunit M [Deltaproteobacteria bacterium]|nr:xanthine dehydrogenase family protein subunit M [Deltaproteobacteria bacterium]